MSSLLSEMEQESNILAVLTGSFTRVPVDSSIAQDIVDCSSINMWALVIRVL